ncbi:fungal-specific transcription factor domain-containing protein [Massariosphaeria phaeospora]|uniref:Fungal-specific transcription factor domain-containing protein n=1 Tax=Massariosphaeria phaeospora TaxID=100035 RepID=A0A7C8HZ70_9PLEO|nr:fungal-specific transcription factor domain-containing protein [Massariosphaeria phaeospora]
MDATGSHEAGRRGSRKSTKRQFMFIDSTSHGTNAKPDKTVRSFVMHQARRQKPWSTRQKNPPSPSPDVDALPSIGSSRPYTTFSLSHGSSCKVPYCTGDRCHYPHVHTSLTRQEGFSLGVLDPFQSLPVRTDEKTSALIDHFVKVVSPRLLPVDLHQSAAGSTMKWFANSLQNTTSAPFTYAVLAASALQLQALGATNRYNVLKYKAQAISEINTLLSDPQTSIDDNNITAVFMLLCLEESQLAPGKDHDDSEWSEMQRAIHLNGLRTMIEQRGGLSALHSNRCLQVFVLMHSIAHSVSTFQRPYATILGINGAAQKYDIPSFRTRPSSAHVLGLFRDLKLDADLLDIIDDITVFVGDISSWFKDPTCLFDPIELQKHGCLLMYRLFDWYSKDEDSNGDTSRTKDTRHTDSPIDASISLALLIFLTRTAQPLDPSYRSIILTTVRKLRAALTTGSSFRWAKSPDLLLWTLTMGALAAQGSTEAKFFTKYCEVAFADAGVGVMSNADNLLKRLGKCLWIPMVFDDEVRALLTLIGVGKQEEAGQVLQKDELATEELKENEVVGLLTSHRFFPDRSV